jgi:hypothetical protein
MRPVDTAFVCPACGERSKSKIQAFEHERPHLVSLLETLDQFERVIPLAERWADPQRRRETMKAAEDFAVKPPAESDDE